MLAARFVLRGLASALLLALAAAPAFAELFIAVGPLAIGAGHSPAYWHGPAGYYGYGYGPAYGYGWGPGYGGNLGGGCNCDGGAAAAVGGGGVGYTGLRDPYPAAYPAPFVPQPSPGYGYYNPNAYWNYAVPRP